MTSNLNILDQYVLCLQGTATKLLELTLHRRDFPSAAVVVAAPLPRVRRAPGAYGGHGPLAYFLGSSYSFLAASTV